MQVDWVKSFLAIVDTGSFGAAAAALYRAQSRVSAHIAALEVEIGTELFDRTKRPIALTAAGRAFLPHARAICDEVDAGRLAAHAADRDAHGQVLLGVYPSAGAIFVPSVVREFSKLCPGAKIELSEHAIAGLDSVLSHGIVTMALRPDEPRYVANPLIIQPLWLEPMVVVVSTEHSEWTDARPLPVCELTGISLIVTGMPEADRTEAGELLAAHGIDATIVYESDQPQTLIGLVRAGLGVGLTNELALRMAPIGRDLISIQTSPPLMRQVNLVRRVEKALSPAAETLWRVILEAPLPSEVTDLRSARLSETVRQHQVKPL